MKKIFLIVVFYFIFFQGYSQSFGIKAGLNLANAKYSGGGITLSTDNYAGFHAGVFSELPIGDNFYFTPGASFSQKGFKLNLLGQNVKTRVNCFDIPLGFTFKYDLEKISLFLQSGPFASINFSGVSEGGGEEVDIEFGSDEGQMKRMDFGILFGAGIEVNQFQFSINYNLGLANLENAEDLSYKTRVLSFSVGFLFGN